jgi:acyl-CoA thioester hydrolase
MANTYTDSNGQIYRQYTPIPIRYEDIDMLQHVNNAKYLAYLEQARIQYARDVLNWDGDWKTLDMIVARIEIDYRKPVYLNDTLGVWTRCSRIGNKSFDFEYVFVVTDADASTVVATARSVMVQFDAETQTSCAVHPTLRAAIAAFEHHPTVV